MSVTDETASSRPAARRAKTTAPQSVPRKAAAKKPEPVADDPQDLPFALNLDDLEREGAVAEPFVFVHKGRQYALTDPQEKDWQRLLLAVNNPLQFLRLVIRDEDRDAFFETPMPAWKLRALTDAYQKHFGLGESGESGGLPV